MSRPSDITEAAWAEAAALRSAVIWQSNAANETIARALMGAEARGRAECMVTAFSNSQFAATGATHGHVGAPVSVRRSNS